MTGIVVGVDGSEGGAAALGWAVREADLHDRHVTAVLAWDWLAQHHNLVGGRFDLGYGEPEAVAALTGYVEQAVGPGRTGDVEQIAVLDSATRALVDASADASLLVLGARGHGGFHDLLLGSVAQQCLHHATCPVAIVRGDGNPPPGVHCERIVIGIDGSAAALRALAWAADEARARKASLEVVHGWELPYLGGFPDPAMFADPAVFEDAARRTLDAAVDAVDTVGLAHPVEHILTAGGAAAAVLAAAKGADLLVVGSRGHGGFTRLLLGSVSQHVAHHASCPVVVVPAGPEV